jgi:hypothetical protein
MLLGPAPLDIRLLFGHTCAHRLCGEVSVLDPRQLFKNVGFWISMAAMVATGILAWYMGYRPAFRTGIQPFLLIVGAVWFIAVPLWFCAEWAMFTPTEPNKIENFKYSQKLARDFWLSTAAVIAFLLGIDLTKAGFPPHVEEAEEESASQPTAGVPPSTGSQARKTLRPATH